MSSMSRSKRYKDRIGGRKSNNNKDILFAATANRFPSETIDVIPDRDRLGKFCWLSSGMVIGKTTALVEFYRQAKDLALKDTTRREQAICRELFNNAQDRIGFDYSTDIFYTASWACIDERENEIVFD